MFMGVKPACTEARKGMPPRPSTVVDGVAMMLVKKDGDGWKTSLSARERPIKIDVVCVAWCGVVSYRVV